MPQLTTPTLLVCAALVASIVLLLRHRPVGLPIVAAVVAALEVLAAGLGGCDVVYHAGAAAQTWGDAAEMERINVGGTERMLAAARAAGVRRFVHVSTEAVLLGGPPLVNVDETRPRPARPL